MVEVVDEGRKVWITRLQYGIRRRVEAAAKGDLRSLKELLNMRDVKESGPLAPERQLILSLDEFRVVRAAGGQPLPARCDYAERAEAGGSQWRRSQQRRSAGAARGADAQPYRSVAELVEFELERRTWVTDPATGARQRMTMREAHRRTADPAVHRQQARID